MRKLVVAILAAISIQPAFAQLTPSQRAIDLQSLAAMFAKRYAPAQWKKQALGFDVLNLKPWLDQVNSVPDDLGFLELEARYVAQLNDIHTSFLMNSNFSARLGFTADIYDGKTLIDSINRTTLALDMYPFDIGDELVSVDGKAPEEWIAIFSRLSQRGNPVNTRRAAAAQIATRFQALYPRAHEIGDSAAVTIRRQSGEMESYTIPWVKSGLPVTSAGPAQQLQLTRSDAFKASDRTALTREDFRRAPHWKLPDRDISLRTIDGVPDTEGGTARKYVVGVGSRAPVFVRGLPADFVLRLGRSTADFHYSGTFKTEGYTIGYLRIPSFDPRSITSAVRELDREIAYMQDNTDGLVVDVMRNPGGGCYMLDAASRLIPYPFYFFGEQIRVTQDRLNDSQDEIDFMKRFPQFFDATTIDAYQQFQNEMIAAMKANRLTAPIPACTNFDSDAAPVLEGNQPAAIVYNKPMIVLVDEFSTSAADIFPAMIQDNGRAKLAGARTNGGGGTINEWPTGFFSESFSTDTETLVVRKNPIVSPNLPTAPYIENIGAIPEIPLNYMTKENLLNNGQTFVGQFAQAIVSEIRSSQP